MNRCAPESGSTRWPLERVLFALAGTITLLSALLAAVVSPWFLPADGVRRRQPVALRGVRRLPGLDCALPRLFGPPLLDLPEGGSAMNDLGPIGRLGHWTATHFRAPSSAIGWVPHRRRLRRPRPPRRERPLGRRLGGDRVRIGRGAQPRSTPQFEGLGQLRIDGRRQAPRPRAPAIPRSRRRSPASCASSSPTSR